MRRHAVVADIQYAPAIKPQALAKAPGDDLAVENGPCQRAIMLRQIGLRLGMPSRNALARVCLAMRLQDGLSQPARATVNHHPHAIMTQAQVGKACLIGNGFDALEFDEVVATTNRAQRRTGDTRRESNLGQSLRMIACPRRVEPVQLAFDRTEAKLAHEAVGFPQGHAAADVATDEMRPDVAWRPEGRAHGNAIASMQIGQADNARHSVITRARFELI